MEKNSRQPQEIIEIPISFKLPFWGLIVRFVKDGKPAGQKLLVGSLNEDEVLTWQHHLMTCEDCQANSRKAGVHHFSVQYGDQFVCAWFLGEEDQLIFDEAVFAARLSPFGV